MSLHYLVKLEMLIAHVAYYRWVVRERTREFIPPQPRPSTSPDLNAFDNSMLEILQDKVYKTRITDLELSTTPLTNGRRNDDMIQLGLILQSLFRFI